MTRLLLKSFLMSFLIAISTTEGKGILEALKSDLHSVAVPDCDPSSEVSLVANDPHIMTAIEKPPLHFAHTTEASMGPQATEESTVQLPAEPSTPPLELSCGQPRIVGHTYHLYKTILKPQLFRQIITVPYIQRYVRYFQVPVIETYHIKREVPF